MRVLLLLPAAGYANQDFQHAARKLGVEIVACADYCHRLAPDWGLPPLMAVAFDQPETSVTTILAALTSPVDAVLASDDHGVELAVRLRATLGLAGNPPEAVLTLADKLNFRCMQRDHGLPHPAFCVQDADNDRACIAFPLVVKARRLNASRGVIRADTPAEFTRALAQVRRIQARHTRDADALGVLLEAFIPGVEVALEGVLRAGELTVLALFDKPDPLDGPTFEETIYVTPSRLPAATQHAIADAVNRACAIAGVVEGAIHAEARINDAGVWLLEIAPRAIGGLCGRILTATVGMGSAEIVLRHALGLPLTIVRNASAAGVMMIPIPARGMLLAVEGVAAARAVAGISGVEITAAAGQLVAPPPDGASYLGFIFSRADDPAAAEAALRAAYAKLVIRIQALV
jgi:biotin carboxylase